MKKTLQTALGAVNILAAAAGIWCLLGPTIVLLKNPIPYSGETPYEMDAFWVLTALNFAFLCGVAAAGVLLVWRHRCAYKWAAAVMVSILLFPYISSFVSYFVLPRTLRRSVGAAWGIGNMGLGLLDQAYYPIWMLIGIAVLALLGRKSRQQPDVPKPLS